MYLMQKENEDTTLSFTFSGGEQITLVEAWLTDGVVGNR